jgi:hypothetical protein
VFSGIRDLGNHSGYKLEGVDALGLCQVLVRIMVGALGGAENLCAAFGPSHPRQTHGSSKNVAGDLFESRVLSSGNADGLVDAKTASSPGEQELGPLFTEKLLVLQKTQDPMAEELFCLCGVDVGKRRPFALSIPATTRADPMDVGMEWYLVTEQLHDGDHPGAELLNQRRRGHQLLQGVIGSAGQIAEKLSVMALIDYDFAEISC